VVRRPCLLILTRDWSIGGAERQVVELLKVIDKRSIDICAATFYGTGPLRRELQGLPGVRLWNLRKRGRWDVVPFLLRAVRLARRVRPDVIHGYQGFPNLLTLILGWVTGARTVWGMRASNMDMRRYDWLRRIEAALETLCARAADLIIVNSEAGRRYHVARGFPEERTIMIPNGIDVERFRPDAKARTRMRWAWGVGGSDRLIGLICRLDPMKDHATFLAAAKLLADERPEVRFICVGDGPSEYASGLHALAARLGLERRVFWKPQTDEIAPVYAALDVLTSTSRYGEGFPNVVAEAMATGVPCVVTDVGDSAFIVGDTGIVVPVGHPQALAAAWRRLLDEQTGPRPLPREDARERIVRLFGLEALGTRTLTAISELMSDRRSVQ